MRASAVDVDHLVDDVLAQQEMLEHAYMHALLL